MNTVFIVEMVILVACIFLSAFFSASETALTSMTKLRIKRMVEEYGEKALFLEKAVRKWDSLLITLLICNNVVNLGAASLTTILIAKALPGYGMDLVAAIATGSLTFVILVFGEITPKSFAKQYAETYSLAVIKVLERLSRVFYPLIILFKFLTIIIFRLVGAKVEDKKHMLTENDIVAIVNAGEREGVLEEEERDMIHAVIELGETVVHKVMIPRVDMATVHADDLLKDVWTRSTEGRFYSRVPVLGESIDDVTGILYTKDLIKYAFDEKFDEMQVKHICRKPFFVSENAKLDDVLRDFRKEHMHMAVVVDEYGGTAGLITIEDLLEEIVGDIRDEHDEEEEELLRSIGDQKWIVLAKVGIADLNEELDIRIPEDGNFDSLGGFITMLEETVPKRGDKVRYQSLLFEVLEADEKRIHKLKLEKLPDDDLQDELFDEEIDDEELDS